MASSLSNPAPYRLRDVSGVGAAPLRRESYFIAAWWLWVAVAGMVTVIFGNDFLPAKFSYDTATVREQMNAADLWTGVDFDSFVSTARVFWLLFHVMPEALLNPVYYCLLVAGAMRLLDVYGVDLVRYHVFAGGWIVCASLFLGGLSKELIALPVALWLCLASSWGSRLLATTVFLLYAAFFRPYWAICYFYFAFALLALRLHIANRSRLAALVLLLAFLLPFLVASPLDYDPLTEARMMVNVERVDSPDARSAFTNPFENTGPATDVANAAFAWVYMNVPVALLRSGTPHYVFFVGLQLCSLWFFVAGCARFLRDARRARQADPTRLRCAAFVIAYSLTQSIFEPDFGSFLRHEVVLMIPMLIIAFYRAHARRPRAVGVGLNC